MLTNDFNRWNNKEQFQQWFEDHCKDCWGNGYGDCEKCKQLKANIESKYANDGKKVLTDKDIINRLTELASFCRKCGNLKKENDVLNNALDLINRQQAENNRQKAEIEKLQLSRKQKIKEIERLTTIAKKMHSWIFTNSYDEEKAYAECGLTDEENALLGYCGKIIFESKEMVGDDNDT